MNNDNNMISSRDAFGKALVENAKTNERLLVFDSDVCTSTRTHYFREAFPDRFYECGIAEANMIGMAAGMAAVGYTPFVSAFAVFLAKRALDQIRVSVAYPRLNVKLNGAYAGLPTGRGGATHSAIEDMAIMRAMPNMTVLVPGDPVETADAVRLALETTGPVYLRTVRCSVPVIFPEDHKMILGKGLELHSGEDIALISTGMMTPKTLAAAEILEGKGIKARVIHLGTIKPLDREIIIRAAKDCGHIITIENHSIYGGLGGAVAEVLSEYSPCFQTRIGFPDIFMESGDDDEIFSKLGMNTENIVRKVQDILLKKGE